MGQNATNFKSNGWVFSHEKNQTVSHTNEPSFKSRQWSIKYLLQSCGMNLGLKSQPKLNWHCNERLVKIADREWTKLVFRKQDEVAFLSRIFILWFVYGRASLPGCKQHMKVLAWIFSAQYGCGIKIAESRVKFQVLQRIALVCKKFSEKFSWNSFFHKFQVRISTKIGTKRYKFQVKRMSILPRKRSNSFTHKRTFLSSLQWLIKYLFPIFWAYLGLKSQPKLNRHSEEHLVKISDQKTKE